MQTTLNLITQIQDDTANLVTDEGPLTALEQRQDLLRTTFGCWHVA